MDEDYKKIFELSLDLICIADLKKKVFEKVNPAFALTLGYTIDELEGQPYIDFVHPDDIEATEKVVEEQLLAERKFLIFRIDTFARTAVSSGCNGEPVLIWRT